MKKLCIFASLGLIAMLALPAHAQDETSSATNASSETNTVGETSSATTDAITEQIEQAGLSAEAIEDQTVTEEDLGAKTPGRFHFLKKMTRAVQRIATTDPIKEAKMDIEEAHEELLRAKKITEENPGDEKSSEKAQKAIAKFEQKIEKVKERAEAIRENKADQANSFLEKIADAQIKQQKMLDNLEEKLPEQAFEKVREARENALAHASEIFTKVAQNKEQIAQTINAAMEKQTGSEFNGFKQMEIMERLREHMPEEAKTAIEQVQIQARMRFEEQLNQLPEEAKAQAGEKFQRYVQNTQGDPFQQMKMLDQMKSQSDVTEEFLGNIELAKEKALNKFEEQMRRFNPANQELLLQNAGDGDVEDMRVMQQIRENMPDDLKQTIETKEKQAIEQFKQKFVDNPDAQKSAEKFEELAKKMRNNPDSSTMGMINKLKQELPQDQQNFVKNLETEASAGFQEKYTQEKEKFLKRIESFDTQSIENFKQFQQNAPTVSSIINQAVQNQAKFISERIEATEDPVRFERIKEQLEDNPEIKQEIQRRVGNFEQKLQNREQEIGQIKEQMEQQFQERIEEQNRTRAEQGLAPIKGQQAQDLKERFLLKPQTQVKEDVIEQFKNSEEAKIRQRIENENRFEPKQFEPGSRGDARSDERKSDSSQAQESQTGQIQKGGQTGGENTPRPGTGDANNFSEGEFLKIDPIGPGSGSPANPPTNPIQPQQQQQNTPSQSGGAGIFVPQQPQNPAPSSGAGAGAPGGVPQSSGPSGGGGGGGAPMPR